MLLIAPRNVRAASLCKEGIITTALSPELHFQERAEKVAAKEAELAARGGNPMHAEMRSIQPSLQQDTIRGWGEVEVAKPDNGGWVDVGNGNIKPESPSAAQEDSQGISSQEGEA